jgi:hypothetical protein
VDAAEAAVVESRRVADAAELTVEAAQRSAGADEQQVELALQSQWPVAQRVQEKQFNDARLVTARFRKADVR